MAKAEISWRRITAEGVRLQVYARHVGRDWRFFARERRYDLWQAVPEPPLEDWLELLDAVDSAGATFVLLGLGRVEGDEVVVTASRGGADGSAVG